MTRLPSRTVRPVSTLQRSKVGMAGWGVVEVRASIGSPCTSIRVLTASLPEWDHWAFRQYVGAAFRTAAVVRSCLAVWLLSMARNRMLIAASQETGENREQADAASAQLSRQSRDFRELREDYVRNKCGNAWD